MNKILGFTIFAALTTFSVPAAVHSAEMPNTRVTYPTGVSAEILGRGLLWSVNFDQVVAEQMAVGIGFGTASTEKPDGTDGDSATMLPVYMNYYFTKSGNTPFVTGGANVILNSKDVKANKANVSSLNFPSDAIMPTFGLGYEARMDNGFFFRAAGYALVGDNVKPWMGFTFGQAF